MFNISSSNTPEFSTSSCSVCSLTTSLNLITVMPTLSKSATAHKAVKGSAYFLISLYNKIILDSAAPLILTLALWRKEIETVWKCRFNRQDMWCQTRVSLLSRESRTTMIWFPWRTASNRSLSKITLWEETFCEILTSTSPSNNNLYLISCTLCIHFHSLK